MKKLFKKVFKSIKKVFKPIGKELKRGLKGVGKFFGKLGPVGTLALSLMIPGVGTLLGSLGTAVGNVAATAPWSGTIFGPLGKVIQGVAQVAKTGGNVYSSITKFVGDTVNTITGGTFKQPEMIAGPDGKMIVNPDYKQGYSRKFGDWVSKKLDKTRRMFGLETGMDAQGFDATLEANAKKIENKVDVNSIAAVDTTKIDLTKPTLTFEEKLQASFDAQPKGILDRELKAEEVLGRNELGLLDTKISPTDKTIAELYPDRETIDVPIGYDETTSETLGKFANDKNSFNRINMKTKTVFKDQLTPDQIDAIDIENTNYYADFQNNRLDKTEKFVGSLNAEDTANLTADNIDIQLLRQDAAAITKPATFVGGLLTPDAPPESDGSSDGSVQPLSTDTDIKQYMGGVEAAYAGLGYKGPQTLDGYHMAGAYGNTPYNYFQIGQRSQPMMTTPMPTI
jgi:hypothetical protein